MVQSDNCPGGKGLTKEQMAVYLKASKKDWAAAHAAIVGQMNQNEKDKIAEQFNFISTTEYNKLRTNNTLRPVNKLAKPVYACSFCDTKLVTKVTWACHELEHTGWKYYRCVKCGKEFDRENHSAFHDHIKGKLKKQTCPGGMGLNQEDFESFRNQCKKDWQAEHDRIIGKKENSVSSNGNVQKDFDNQVNHSRSDLTLAVVHGKLRAIQQAHRIKNCRVLLTPLNNVHKDGQTYSNSSDFTQAATNSKPRAIQKDGVKKCRVVLTRLNILTVMPD